MGIVAHELNRRVDFVSDSCRQGAHRLEFLRVAKLQFHFLVVFYHAVQIRCALLHSSFQIVPGMQ